MAVCRSMAVCTCVQVGKPAAALDDALMAVQLDPKFFKAVSRAATCHCRCVSCAPLQVRVMCATAGACHVRQVVACSVCVRACVCVCARTHSCDH